MLAHKAVHQGHVAAEAASGLKSFMDAKIVPSVAYTDPEIAWVGLTEDGAKVVGRAVETAKFRWAASGRAIANGADYGLTKLVFDKETHHIIGGAIVGPSAGDMIGEICLAIEMGRMQLTSARPSIRTRRSGKPSAWLRKSPNRSALICPQSKSASGEFRSIGSLCIVNSIGPRTIYSLTIEAVSRSEICLNLKSHSSSAVPATPRARARKKGT